MTYLSLGAGIQSTAMLILSNRGLFGCPRADVAIFADTQAEPSWVYEHLDVLRGWSDIPIHVVTAGDLMQDVVDRHEGRRQRSAAIPAWTPDATGRGAPLRRQCTRDYKIDPIEKHVRKLLGYKPRQRIREKVYSLIGISLDEATRAKTSRTPWVTNLYPLLDARLRRHDCVRIIEAHVLPVPRKSACVFCPYHSTDYWRDLKENHPEEFARAVEFDGAIRDMSMSGVERPVYIHRSCKPLGEVDFTKGGQTTFDFFEEECEGMCGV